MPLPEPQLVRAAFLNPRPDGSVEYVADGALLADRTGRLLYAGTGAGLAPLIGSLEAVETRLSGILTPVFLDCHTHISQYAIRGRFDHGLPEDCRTGRLLAGLERNVFPEEARAASEAAAAAMVQAFAKGTLRQGVVGGASYMTVHPEAARVALRLLPTAWSVGLVLMDQNCPEYYRTDAETLARDVCGLAEEFGQRLILTDRFAVSVSGPLRRQAVWLAARLGLRMQTHLNEQREEKAFVEQTLYPEAGSYTAVYAQDGLLDRCPVVAHCVQMRPEEWDLLARPGVAVAHCPTSNTLLGSGVMDLDALRARGLPYALCSDVGASPTPSLLVEMAQFLKVHAGQSASTTPSEALFRATLAPAQILGLDRDFGSFAPGKRLAYVEIDAAPPVPKTPANTVIFECLLDSPSGRGLEEALTRLRTEGLPHGADLARLAEDVSATVTKMERKVKSVVSGTGGLAYSPPNSV